MGSHFQSAHAILCLMVLLTLASRSNAGGVVVYWGQNTSEGRLTQACATGNFQIVNIAFLSVFGNGREPLVNLTRHCNAALNGCHNVSAGVKNCHNQGVKVLLSIGGPHNTYSISSSREAKDLADYIWNNFLGGNSTTRPFGEAVLDGVDFYIEHGDPYYYGVLARRLFEYGKRGGPKVYITASPKCSFPDHHLAVALSTGVFDYVWVRFYNNVKCQYRGESSSGFKRSWKQWTTFIPTEKFYVGVAASDAVGGGYVAPDELINKVLPIVKNDKKYGGVMLSDRANDVQSNYSFVIKSRV